MSKARWVLVGVGIWLLIAMAISAIVIIGRYGKVANRKIEAPAYRNPDIYPPSTNPFAPQGTRTYDAENARAKDLYNQALAKQNSDKNFDLLLLFTICGVIFILALVAFVAAILVPGRAKQYRNDLANISQT